MGDTQQQRGDPQRKEIVIGAREGSLLCFFFFFFLARVTGNGLMNVCPGTEEDDGVRAQERVRLHKKYHGATRNFCKIALYTRSFVYVSVSAETP